MRLNPTEEREDVGVRHVEAYFRDELRWLFRIHKWFDYGIDAHAEVVSVDTPEPMVTGRLLAIQVKSGDSYFDSPRGEDGWTFRDSNDHLAYWLGGSLPAVVILVNSAREAYWQVISVRTVVEHEKSFSVLVPRSQRLDPAAAAALTDLARRPDGLFEQLPRHLALLSPGVVHLLKQVEQDDRLGAARLAEFLAGGRGAPALTTDAVLSADPSWLSGSPQAAAMWRTVGVYASDHNCLDLAAEAFVRAANEGSADEARDLAQAGLLEIPYNRYEARRLLEEARALKAGLLADIGLAQLEIPADSGAPFPVPESIKHASGEELAAEPVALMFLAGNASREGRLDEAVNFAQRAVYAADVRDTRTRLELARLIHRRGLMTDMAHTEFRRALSLAGEVVEERRRWDGPSAEALAVYLDMQMMLLPSAAVVAALPAESGGSARQVEAADPQIVRRGAFAALETNQPDAFDHFIRELPDGSLRRELTLHAAAGKVPRSELIAGYRAVLTEADDEMAVRIVAALAKLGVWPDQAEDLHERNILPDEAYRLLHACFQARSQDQVLGIARLEEMAPRSAHAAQELVTVLELLEGPEHAIERAEGLCLRWPASGMQLQLLDLYGRHGRDEQASTMIERCLGDEALPVDIRLKLAAWHVARTANQGLNEQAAAFAARALQFGAFPELIWNYITVLHRAGDVVAARTALARYRPEPVVEDEARLWLDLHLGVDLAIEDAPVLIDVAHRLPDGPLRDVAIALLVREVLLAPSQPGTQHSEQVREEAARMEAQARNRPGGFTRFDNDNDETLRTALEPVHIDQTAFQHLVAKVGEGRAAQVEISRIARQPYATALLRRPAGVIPATDLSPALRRVGQDAAASALASGGCVADLSSLYLLSLLHDEDRARIRSALKRIVVARSSVTDVSMARDNLRVLDLSSYTVTLLPDGAVQRSTLTALQKQMLRDQASALEELVSQARSANPTVRSDSANDTLAIAEELGSVLWCDDASSRQSARQRGLRTFSTLDLLDALNNAGHPVNAPRVHSTLARHYVVDLPLDAEAITSIARDRDWTAGYALLPLTRPAWWRYCEPQLPHAWLTIATCAAEQGPQVLLQATRAALYGAVQAIPAGQITQQVQRLLVDALVGCHLAECQPLDDFLTQVAHDLRADLAPKPVYVLHALIDQLRQHRIGNPFEVAFALMPGVLIR